MCKSRVHCNKQTLWTAQRITPPLFPLHPLPSTLSSKQPTQSPRTIAADAVLQQHATTVCRSSSVSARCLTRSLWRHCISPSPPSTHCPPCVTSPTSSSWPCSSIASSCTSCKLSPPGSVSCTLWNCTPTCANGHAPRCASHPPSHGSSLSSSSLRTSHQLPTIRVRPRLPPQNSSHDTHTQPSSSTLSSPKPSPHPQYYSS